MAKKQFAIWDWVLFGAMLGISALIGVFYALKSRFGVNQNTTGEFLMGGRKLQLLPVSISILVSFMSAITILGAPAEMYTAGTMYFLYTLGLILACLTSACLFVPLFYPLKLTSSFEVRKIFTSYSNTESFCFIFITFLKIFKHVFLKYDLLFSSKLIRNEY